MNLVQNCLWFVLLRLERKPYSLLPLLLWVLTSCMFLRVVSELLAVQPNLHLEMIAKLTLSEVWKICHCLCFRNQSEVSVNVPECWVDLLNFFFFKLASLYSQPNTMGNLSENNQWMWWLFDGRWCISEAYLIDTGLKCKGTALNSCGFLGWLRLQFGVRNRMKREFNTHNEIWVPLKMHILLI